MTIPVHGESNTERYHSYVALVTELLELALDLGQQGMLRSSSGAVRRSIAEMSRAYQCALSRSFRLSLTKHDCASIDEKSHQIETLRAALQSRTLDCENLTRFSRPRKKALFLASKRAEIFLGHCTHWRQSAENMRRLNASLMHSSRFRTAHFSS